MDVFSLRDAVVGEYKQFATSFTTIHAEDIRRQVDAIYAQDRYWPEPLIQINPNYRRETTTEKLVADGLLDAACAKIFRLPPSAAHPDGEPLTLYKHQQQAIALAADGESYVVTTGTGSGKSLCFFIPIVDAVLKDRERTGARRTRAIIIYPMNALANSQQEELEKYLQNHPGERPVTFARYTGQDDQEERRRISEDPPDILLTNFMMLELLMTRQDELDRKVIGNCAGLNFLVLDELHTYRGRQGADVALLVRRVREQLAPEKLQCVGTSATMASEGSLVEKNRLVAAVASKLFSTDIPESNVVVETLERATDPELTSQTVRSNLAKAISTKLPANISDAKLRKHPLAVWVETRLGIQWSEVDQRWERARPMTLSEAVTALAEDSGATPAACSEALRDLLLTSSIPEDKRTSARDASRRGFFAFKLHQFVSGAGHAFITLEPAGERVITVEAQQFLPAAPTKRLYPVHFCRKCGHEYLAVRRVDDADGRRFHARNIDDAPPRKNDDDVPEGEDEEPLDEAELAGFVTPHPPDAEFRFGGLDDDYPDTWLEQNAQGEVRLKAHYRKARVQEVHVDPTGRIDGGMRAWFIPERFRFCLRCGDTHTGPTRDRNRLASLSAEGRSSATTVLVASALRWMHADDAGLEPHKRKLLGFTDNRQDAALQSGHFNDFLFVSLVRAGFLRALELAGDAGIDSEKLGQAHQQALGLDQKEVRGEWLLDADLKGLAIQDAGQTLRDLLAYRLWFDQRRGWRYTNPNLEQLQLVKVEYKGLDELAADDGLFEKGPELLRRVSAATRAQVFTTLFDHLRQGMAIRSKVLERSFLELLAKQSFTRLRAPWGFGSDELPREARWLMIHPPPRRNNKLRDEELLIRGGPRSTLGKVLRRPKLWDHHPLASTIKTDEYAKILHALLDAARKHGLVSEENTPFENEPGWRLSEAAVLFKKADGAGPADAAPSNAYFRALYRGLADLLASPGHPLFGFEAREHTAQVESEKRQVREKRFRFGEKEQAELGETEKHLREIGEANRFLPVLFCSPTMELGVDISALNAVYLRNIPPTPANYAQRSGRAGRSGQAALVLTYCAALSPHDQYFFRDPKQMVHGEVRAPLLDLANRELVESHLHAVWLASTHQPLDPSIAELLVLEDPARPLRPVLQKAISEPRIREEAVKRIRRVLDLLETELTRAQAPWYPGRDAFAEAVVQHAAARFDEAFDRWRELLTSAEAQRDAARRTIDSYSSRHNEREAAKTRHNQAIQQIGLLQQGSSKVASDFYTYRYLATEGFLPGYNFPRLPLMAFVPATVEGGGGKQTYLQRPRFLALSEFGPRSLVYHEGRAYRVVRALLSMGAKEAATPDVELPTKTVRICQQCGGGHFSATASVCHACRAPLGDAETINHVFRIENVGTQPAERITANDEERQRQGFDLQTTFEWASRDHELDVRHGAAADAEGELLWMAYGAGATITRLNKGLRRRANRRQLGFKIDPVTGFWAKNEDEDDGKDPTVNPRQWIVPSVSDQKNALLVQPSEPDLELKTLATLQHALLRGIETVFQLEEGEMLAEPMPTREDRNGFLLYEATEGGAGVLTRLVTEPMKLAEVAKVALEVMHFEVATDLPPTADGLRTQAEGACVAACYRCLLSYYNQPDHELLDRRDEIAKELLLRLARATTVGLSEPGPELPSAAPSGTGSAADRWRAEVSLRGLPAPDARALHIDGTEFLVWRDHYVAAFLGKPSKEAVDRLLDSGITLIAFEGDDGWPDAFGRLAAALGR